MKLTNVMMPVVLAAVLSGCVASGTGMIAGVPNGQGQQAGGSQGAQPTQTTTAGQPANSTVAQPLNGSSANKAVVGLVVSTDSLVLTTGKTQQVQGTVTYVDGTKDGNISWSSSDTTFVTVNEGKIQAVKAGVATVQAKSASDPSKFANVTVTVKAGVVEDAFVSIEPKAPSVVVGNTVQMSATIQNTEGKTTPNGTWSSSNSTIAKVGSTGIVTGIKTGKATITFTSDQDSTVKSSTEVTVTAE